MRWGRGDAPISPRKPLPDYIVEKRFAEPVATDQVISMTLSRLAATLVATMEKQGKGARRLEASFFRTDGVVRAIVVDTGRPVTQAGIIDRLFRERLDALNDPLDPGFGFDLIRLSAGRTEIVVQQQRDLDAHVHDSDELSALIDRIAARIGGKTRGRVPAAGHPYSRTRGAGGTRAASADRGDAGGVAGAGSRVNRLCGRCGCSKSRSRSRCRLRRCRTDLHIISPGVVSSIRWSGWRGPNASRWNGGSRTARC